MNNVIVVGMMSALKRVVTRQGLQLNARTIIPGDCHFSAGLNNFYTKQLSSLDSNNYKLYNF